MSSHWEAYSTGTTPAACRARGRGRGQVDSRQSWACASFLTLRGCRPGVQRGTWPTLLRPSATRRGTVRALDGPGACRRARWTGRPPGRPPPRPRSASQTCNVCPPHARPRRAHIQVGGQVGQEAVQEELQLPQLGLQPLQAGQVEAPQVGPAGAAGRSRDGTARHGRDVAGARRMSLQGSERSVCVCVVLVVVVCVVVGGGGPQSCA